MVTFDAARLDRISTQAREVHLGRLVLTVLAAVLFGIGWAAFKSSAAFAVALAWSIAAVRVGWTDAKASRATQRRS